MAWRLMVRRNTIFYKLAQFRKIKKHNTEDFKSLPLL
jgi:hypothetical protein